MQQLSEFSIVLSSLTLAASLSSLVGAAFILICYAILPLEYHFRHVLILNLSIAGEQFITVPYILGRQLFSADFFNALTNSIGGIYILSRERNLADGPACILQGLVGQITVQVSNSSAVQ